MKQIFLLFFLIIGISLELFTGLQNGDPDIILWIRISVVLQQILIGIILSGGGLILQTLIHNPLAEPYTLGVTGGASAGAVIAVFIGLSPLFFFRTLFALIGAVFVSTLIFFFSSSKNKFSMNTAILAGVGFNALFSGLILLLQSLLLPNDLQSSIHWLMGQIDYSEAPEIILLSIATLGILSFLFLYRKQLEILLTGEEMALATGVDVGRLQSLGFITVSLSSAIAVSLSGMIGFVGLIVPHISKLISPEKALPSPLTMALLSSALMVYAGFCSKHIVQGSSLPVGIITSLIGAPFFIFLLIKQNQRVSA